MEKDTKAPPAADPVATAAESQTEDDFWSDAIANLRPADQDDPGPDPASGGEHDDAADPEPAASDAHGDDPAKSTGASDQPDPTDQHDDPEAEAAALQKERERIEQQVSSEKGRVLAHQRKLEEKRREHERITARLERLRAQQDDTAKERRKQLDALAEEYGDTLGPITQELDASAKRFDALIEDEAQRADELQGELERDEAELNAAIARETAEFNRLHPDAGKIMSSYKDVFRDWIDDQPKRLREIAARNTKIVDAAEASELYSAFKKAIDEAGQEPAADAPASGDRKQQSDLRKSQQRGARTATNTGGRRASTDPDPNSDGSEVWDWAVKKAKAK